MCTLICYVVSKGSYRVENSRSVMSIDCNVWLFVFSKTTFGVSTAFIRNNSITEVILIAYIRDIHSEMFPIRPERKIAVFESSGVSKLSHHNGCVMADD